MTTVVSIGCSHTHGSMIDGKNGTSLYNKEHAYGPQLAKMNNFSFLNLGLPGGSNQYIFRATINFLVNHYNTNDDYIFLIGWTSINRMEFRYSDTNNYIHNIIGDLLDLKYIPYTTGMSKALMHTVAHRQLLDLAPLFFDNIHGNDEWAGFVYGLQEILQQKNCKYLMFNTCNHIEKTCNNTEIIKKFDTSKYINPCDFSSCLLKWATDRGYQKTECWHFREDAHIAWAKFLDSHCKKLQYY